MGLPVLEQTISGSVKQVLVEQNLGPDGDAQGTPGKDLVSRGCGDDARVPTTGTGGTVAFAADDSPVCPDFDLQDFAILGACEGFKGIATGGAVLCVVGQVANLHDGRQVGMVASLVAWLSGLLTACFLWCCLVLWCRIGCGRGLGPGAEELVFAES